MTDFDRFVALLRADRPDHALHIEPGNGFPRDYDVPPTARTKVWTGAPLYEAACAYFDASGACVWDACEQGVPLELRPSYWATVAETP